MISRRPYLFMLGLSLFFCAVSSSAQSSGTIEGVVKDPSGAAVPDARVEISYAVSGYHREVSTDIEGSFRFTNIPFNPYHLAVTATGFNAFTQDVDVRSTVPSSLQINLALGSTSSTVTVEASGAELVETESIPHTDVDRELFDKLPLESASSSVSSLVTLASPGVVADSNGLFHGLGDHAENSFSVDGQPITDQQSKVFSNQIPVDSIQSMEVIAGAPPAEYGDKTSLVIKVTTRSGLGQKQPTGSLTTSYGSFGSVNAGANVAFGGNKWGNFITANGLNSGRFLDPPELQVMHSKGNQENGFDRLDLQPSLADSIHLNFGYTRSWFQTPNSYDAQFHPCSVPAILTCNTAGTVIVNPVNGVTPLGPADQRSQIKTFNVAPAWTHVIGTTAVFTLGGFVRRDQYNYYPSADPFADFTTALQTVTAGQNRALTNAGARSDLSYVKGAHNLKVGVTYQHTFLTETDSLGIIDPTLTLGLGLACTGADAANPVCKADLTTGTGSLFHFHGHTDVKEVALYIQDTITVKNFSFNLGVRGDSYRGIVRSSQAEPRAGVAYNIKATNTVLRASYARVMETPFNENLIVGSVGDPNGVFANVVGTPGPVPPGQRNEFHAGFQQAFGKHLVVDADYLWKYTHNGYDFSVLFNTPIFFPIAWHNSKINGPSVRVSVPNFHGLTAFFTGSSVASRFFFPQVGGLGTDLTQTRVFRIDHDQKFQQTTHIQYQPRANWPWIGFNWRYDNGLVVGAAPCFNTSPALTNGCSQTVVTQTGNIPLVDLNGLSADQQYQAGLFCGSVTATPARQITSSLSTNPAWTSDPAFDGPSVCPAEQYGSTLIKIPPPGTEDDDRNPKRIAPRNLFDLSLGDDNLFHKDKYKWSMRVTVINVANKLALYNFLSTFSGTHYVTPRTITGELGFHF